MNQTSSTYSDVESSVGTAKNDKNFPGSTVSGNAFSDSAFSGNAEASPVVEHKEHFHGSDLEKIEAIYHIPKEEIISFAANVNPLGLSPMVKSGLADNIDVLTSYPDREYTALRKAISEYVGAPYQSILVGNGSSELISLFAKVCNPRNALIFGPTYSEYEHEINTGNGHCSYFELKESENFEVNFNEFKRAISSTGSNGEACDLVVLCNPNNPTSALISRAGLRDIVSECSLHNINVIADETYMEFVPDFESVTAIPLCAEFSNLIVLRGISKFFASPGLRLGYAVTQNTDLIAAINALQIPWSINSLAEHAGKLMFNDKEYIKRTKEFINSERERMYSELKSVDSIKVYAPFANFILCRIIKGNVTAQDLFDAAIRQKMMIRDCASFTFLDESYFRFCIMSRTDNDRLLEVIKNTFN